jgi:hypothetical protein
VAAFFSVFELNLTGRLEGPVPSRACFLPKFKANKPQIYIKLSVSPRAAEARRFPEQGGPWQETIHHDAGLAGVATLAGAEDGARAFGLSVHLSGL